MRPYLIDSHCHLHFPPYQSDLEAVLARMEEKKVWGITIGTTLGNSEHAIAFSEAYPFLWAAVGLQPEHLSSRFQDPDEGNAIEDSLDADRLDTLAGSSKKVVAIGETGLDFYRFEQGMDVEAAKAKQEASFREHLCIAHKHDLPVVIHCREALERLVQILQEEDTAHRRVNGVVHSFTGTWEQARPLLDLGMHLGMNGIVTFAPKKNADPARSLDRTVEHMPLDRLLVETDAPYLAPVPYRGARNEPVYVEEVARRIAGIRRMDVEEIAKITTENAQKLFALDR